MAKEDVHLPSLDKKRFPDEEVDAFNPERRKVVRIPMEKLKPLPTDEVRRRFKLKYQLEGLK